MSAGSPLDELTALVASGDADKAYDRLRALLGWPAGRAIADDQLAGWWAVVGEVARGRGAPALAELAAAAVRDPDSPDRLYDLGYALIDAGAPEIAATVLWRCLALVGESEEVTCELVAALESARAYRDAFDVLAAHPGLRVHSFMCRYLFAFNAAMSGQLDIVRAVAPALAPDSPDHQVMADSIAAIAARARRVDGAVPLDDNDLRGWHYVLSGGLLCHRSPYGFPEPMHGRYALHVDSLPLINHGLLRLGELIGAHDVPCIYHPPGRGNEIVARAAALRFGLPIAPWPAIGVPAPGLVMLYDLAELPPAEVRRLIERRPDQVVFAHAMSWTQDGQLAPDVATLQYQVLIAPWGQRPYIDSEAQTVRFTAADSRSAEELAREIADAPPLDSELAADDPAGWAALIARVWPLAPGQRSRLWAGGPVASHRFD